jgi:hypothetical protein
LRRDRYERLSAADFGPRNLLALHRHRIVGG